MKAWIVFCTIVILLVFVLGVYVGRYCECDHAYWLGWNRCVDVATGE